MQLSRGKNAKILVFHYFHAIKAEADNAHCMFWRALSAGLAPVRADCNAIGDTMSSCFIGEIMPCVVLLFYYDCFS